MAKTHRRDSGLLVKRKKNTKAEREFKLQLKMMK